MSERIEFNDIGAGKSSDARPQTLALEELGSGSGSGRTAAVRSNGATAAGLAR